MDHWQYLLVLGACLVITLPLELILGARVYRQPRRALFAILPIAVLFLIWDVVAIAAGVWRYNPQYITGITLPFGVPLEEALFFVIIPLCGLLTYGAVSALMSRTRRRRTTTTEPR
ncbi:MAG: lycopene cyclase domain-containing protein [Mycobacterium sp.]